MNEKERMESEQIESKEIESEGMKVNEEWTNESKQMKVNEWK